MEAKKEIKFEKHIVWWNSIHGGKREKELPVGTDENGNLITIIKGHIKVPVVNCQDGTYTF